jgi:hypothetical protein
VQRATRFVMASYVIHVRPGVMGIWVVHPDDGDTPFSEHTNETEAERAAIARTAALEDAAVVVHDCYARVRIVHPGASG